MSRIRVFLADDHAIVRDGLRFLLEAQPDMQVVGQSDNGRDAVRQIAELKPDVAVLDVTMPELNGIEATRQIVQTSPLTQVIILSIHSTSEHVLRALQAGAAGYLLKESAGIEVALAVRAVYQRNHYLSRQLSQQAIQDYIEQQQMPDPLAALSAREREVLQLVVEGYSSIGIAGMLALSPKTVETYRSRLMTKLGIADLPGLVKFAVLHGLTPLT